MYQPLRGDRRSFTENAGKMRKNRRIAACEPKIWRIFLRKSLAR